MPAATPCIHCGQPVTTDGGDRRFCCHGCRAAWHLLQDAGLGEFYRLRDATADGAEGRRAGDDPGAAAFDSPAFRAAWAVALPGGDERIAWYVEGLHCPACVWLVEQLPRLLPGVRWARLDLGTAQLTVAYDPAGAGPAAQARLLAGLGYRVRPFRADAVAAALNREHRSLLLRVAVAGACAVGTMHLTSTLTAGAIAGDLDPAWRPAFAWGSLAVALPGCLWAAFPLHRGAWRSLQQRRWSVDLAASLAILLALGGSAVLAAHGSLASYADAAAMFAALLLAARLAVVQARRRVARAGGGLTHLLPLTATRHADGSTDVVAVADLRPGDLITVTAGQVVPGDGTVVEGQAGIDIAVLTGEPRPVAVAAGDPVAAGATCRSGLATIRLEAVGGDTRLAQVLAHGGTAQAATIDPAATALRWFTPATLGVAAAAGLGWGLARGATSGIEIALAVVVAACPCAIGLAAPIVQAVAAAEAARRGLLIREPGVLTRLAAVRHVVCDKTGTLTEGRLQVVDRAVPAPLRALVFALCRRSGHPASLAIAADDEAAGVQAAPIQGWRELPGRGLEAEDDQGRRIAVGGHALTGVGPGERGATRIGVAVDGRLAGWIDCADPLRPTSRALIAAWRTAGATVHLASGDHPQAVLARAAELDLPGSAAHGGLLPEDKAALVRRLAAEGPVAAVGDGINDAPALSAATIAIGISGGLEAAMERCHVFCARPAEAGPLAVWELGTAAARRIRALLWISAAYNLLAVAGAAAGWFGPLVCAVAMPLSSLTVVALALRPLADRPAPPR